MDGTEDVTLRATDTTGITRYDFGRLLSDALTPPSSAIAFSAKCSHYAIQSADRTYMKLQGVSLDYVGKLCIFDSAFAEETDTTAFKAYLSAQYAAGTPVTIVYKLATPTAFQATGNVSIPALPGTNTIYTNADSVTVTGRADPVATITALQNRVSALESAALN